MGRKVKSPWDQIWLGNLGILARGRRKMLVTDAIIVYIDLKRDEEKNEL